MSAATRLCRATEHVRIVDVGGLGRRTPRPRHVATPRSLQSNPVTLVHADYSSRCRALQ